MGATVRLTMAQALTRHLRSRQGNDGATVLSIEADAWPWVPGDADGDVGVPSVSDHGSVIEARRAREQIHAKQRVGV